MAIEKRFALIGAAALLAGCSLFRWAGRKDMLQDADLWSASDLRISTSPTQGRQSPAPAPQGKTPLPRVLYYADLGPDFIDTSDYPSQQKYNYTLFKQECAPCHTLARAVNSPAQSRLYWHFHLARMNLHSRLDRRRPIAPDQTKAILDFLEYDAQVRKIKRKKEFERQTEELKRQFDPILKHLIENLQNNPQPLLPPSDRRP